MTLIGKPLATAVAVWLTGALLVASPSVAAGEVQASIVGGQDATGKHPYYALITTDEGQPFCGGTLIAATAVATAAHCVEDGAPILVFIGDEPISEPAVPERTRVPRRIAIHPQWDPDRVAFDVAVITIDAVDAPALPIVGPGDEALWGPGRPATVIGHGATVPDGSNLSDELLEAEIEIFSDDVCESIFGDFDAGSTICAGDAEGGVGPCAGDSGGPLIVSDGRNLKLAGITSFGTEVCGEPAVAGFAEVGAPSIRSFILSEVGPAGDADPPSTAFARTPKRRTDRKFVRFVIESDEPGVRFQANIENNGWEDVDAVFRVRNRGRRGRVVVKVRAIDAAGNVDPTPARFRYRFRRD